MDEKMMDQVMAEVMKKLGNTDSNESSSNNESKAKSAPAKKYNAPGITEFVGTAEGDTIGLVIANVDPGLLAAMNLEKNYRSIGVIGGRTGAGPQIMAADEAVKATNTEIVKIELPRDTKGGAGHGSLVVFGADDVSDARRAVEVALKDLQRTFGDVYGNDAGHIELQYTARASKALKYAFGAKEGQAFGIIVGAPAAIGVVTADTALKAANVEVVSYSTPIHGNSFSNECTLTITGDSGAVRQAVLAGKEVGVKLLEALGGKATPTTEPYI